jgi:DNA repair exonuclease SbcCD ATPase subunit
LRRDALHLSRAQAEEEQRRRRMEAAEREVRELQAELTPFLRRYDKEGRMKASECLRAVQEWETEYLRLCREAEQKREALLRFIREKQLNDATEEVALDGYAALEAKERALLGRLTELQEQKRERTLHIERLSQDADRIPELADRVTALEEELALARANADTVASTMKYLEEAKTALSTRYLGGMQESFTKFLSHLTQTAPDAVMDASFDVRLREGGQTRPMESFSRGWRDAVEFCTHLSLTDALYKDGEKPFLLLDDPFVNLDDERLPAARALLEELASDYQILYFVCHKDRI